MIAGEIVCNEQIKEICINENRNTITISIENCGDRTVQIGSHYHFYETNYALKFNREITKGYHLNIVAGMSIRVLAGQKMDVELVEFSGAKNIAGFQGKFVQKAGQKND
mgnify:FL=1